ncbi:MAG: hypothetical protein JWO63_2054, partial [Frankiales bacterium]|nr:hypothetical protein [Frankiales bacterium]
NSPSTKQVTNRAIRMAPPYWLLVRTRILAPRRYGLALIQVRVGLASANVPRDVSH